MTHTHDNCCENCINEGRKGEWTGCCDTTCPCHTKPAEVEPIEELTSITEGDGFRATERLPNELEIMNKINEIIRRLNGHRPTA